MSLKDFSGRARALIAGTLAGFLVLGVELSYRVGVAYDARQGRAMQRETALVGDLGLLRGELRRLDEDTARYARSGRTLWLQRRRGDLARIHRLDTGLGALEEDSQARAAMLELDRQLGAYIRRQTALAASGARTRTDPAQASLAGRRRSIERLLELIVTLKDGSAQELQRTQQEARSALLDATLAILAAGVLATLLLGIFLVQFVIRPISARERRANERCEQEQELGRLKTQLVSMVSHEFNNAIQVIASAASVLEEYGEGLSKDDREKFHRVLKSNVRLLGVSAGNLLNLGRLESGKFATQPRPTDIRGLLRDGVERMELLARRKGLRAALDLPGEPVVVQADPDALSLVVTNLLSNAIKDTPEGGEVRVGLEPAGASRIRVSFKDTGIGISAEDTLKLCQFFFRTEGGKAAASGFGIGLLLVRQLLRSQGSELEISSELGRGSTFSFLLPLAIAAPTLAQSPSTGADHGRVKSSANGSQRA